MNQNFNFIAQTNLQLYHQLQDANYSEQDLIFIHKAYNFATQLFTGFFRGSGKPFIAHLVGTASVLISLNQPIEIVVAGLLHATYELGDFGDGSRGITVQKQNKLRQKVGKQVETYLVKYKILKWNQENITNIYDNLDHFDQEQKEILLIRLANELEDYHDFGVLYCTKYQKRLEYLHNCSHLMVEIAKKLGYLSLANSLNNVFQEALSKKVLSELQNQTSYSYVLATTSPFKRYLGKWRYHLVNSIKRICHSKNDELSEKLNF